MVGARRGGREIFAVGPGESGRHRGKRQGVGISDEEVGMGGEHPIRKQLTEPRLRPPVHNAMKHSVQVCARIHVVGDTRRDDGQDDGRALGAFIEPARPLRSQYTIRTRSHRFKKKMKRCPLSGSCWSTSRTSAIKLSGPLRPSTGWVATNSRTRGGRLSTNAPGSARPGGEPERPRRTPAAREQCRRSSAQPRTTRRAEREAGRPPAEQGSPGT